MEIPSPMAIFILLLDMIETCPIAGFWEWEIIWDHFQNPQIDLKGKNWVEGCRRSRSTSRSEILTQLPSMLETWFW